MCVSLLLSWTGAVYPEAHLEELAAVLRKHPQVLVISDGDICCRVSASVSAPLLWPDTLEQTLAKA